MIRGTWKPLGPNPTTIGRSFSFSFVGFVTALVLVSATPAAAIVTVDQEPDADRFPSGLRVETFVPVGQSFVPTLSWHVGVELLLSMSCSAPLPPAIFTVHLREGSLAGPVLASGTTPAFECPALKRKEWVEILFEEPVALEPGDVYFLTVTTANIAGFWWRAGLNPYPDGAAFVSGSLEPNFDWGFRTLANEVDAFHCYDAKPPKGHPRRKGPEVQLSDQFGDTVARVGKGKQLCFPRDRHGEGIAEFAANLLCYDLKGHKKGRGKSKKSRKSRKSKDPGWEPIEVRVTNEFGVEPGLIVKKPKRLCVPSIANVDPTASGRASALAGPQARKRPNPPDDPADLQLDHFECYGVKISPNLPRFFPSRVPESLCTPVDKNGEGILDPATHLACYAVDRLDEPRPPDLSLGMRVSNQFGEDQRFDVTKPKTVCVPSSKEIVEPSPARCSPVEDGEFGHCRAIIGWGIDPRTGECDLVSGCGCDERCEGRVFRTEGACLQLCGGDPKPDPAGLIVIDDPIFFDLPIDSLRYAVSGYDPDTDLCVTAIWSLRNASDQIRHCDDFGPLFPYVVIAPGEPAGCWGFGVDVELHSVSGCVDWAAFNSPVIPWKGAGPGHTDEVDLELEVTSDVFSGTVRFDGPGQPLCRGLLGIPCGRGEVCIHEPGRCHIDDDFGLCVERPDFCIQIYQPVCGCNRVTYGNECEARVAGISILHRGECRVR